MKEKEFKPIKHLSVDYKVTSRFCNNCKRWRYHEIEEIIDFELDSNTVHQSAKCLKCGQQNDYSSHTVKK